MAEENQQKETPQTEILQTEISQTETPQTEASQTQPPQTEAPQTEAPPTSTQKITEESQKPEIQLKRFLYVANLDSMFISGNAEQHGHYHPDKLPFIKEILDSKTPEVLLNIIEIANGENVLPRRETLFVVLSIALKIDSMSGPFRNKIYRTVSNVIRSEEEFFMLVKYASNKPEGKKVPSGLQKVVRNYYFKKEPLELAKDVTKNKGFYGWTHKDLIKLSHCKTDNNVTNLIVHNVLFGLEKCKKLDIVKESTEAQEIIEYLESAHKFKTSKDEESIIQLLPKLQFTLSQIPSGLNRSRVVWEALLPTLTIQEVVSLLPRMHKAGLLKQDTAVQKKVLEIFKDDKKLRTSGAHPIELFIGLRNFEKGGKPKDPHLIKYLESLEDSKKESDPNYTKKEVHAVEPIKGSAIAGALYKAVTLSYESLQPTGKSIMITIDASARMNDSNCLTTKNVNCLEAAAALALCFLKTEKRAFLAVFNKKTISTMQVDRGVNLYSLIKKLQESPDSENVVFTSPIDWALQKKKQVDVFINMVARFEIGLVPKELRERERNPMDHLKLYSKEMSRNAKLITCTLAVHNNCLSRGQLDGLDINGFDKNVPKLMEAFIKNSFQ